MTDRERDGNGRFIALKKVGRRAFEEQIRLYATGQSTLERCGRALGLDRCTFRKRVNQYFAPEQYGELPKGFFADDSGERRMTMQEAMAREKVPMGVQDIMEVWKSRRT